MESYRKEPEPGRTPGAEQKAGQQMGRRKKTDKGFLTVKEPQIGTGKFKNQIVIRSADLRNVTEVSQEAFANCGNLRDVKFWNIKLISRYSFANCARLKELDFPAGLTQMGIGAFMADKRLEAVRFHRDSSLTALPNLAFSECEALKTVLFPKGLQSIGRRAFYKCGSLNDAELPLSLKVIGAEAFYGCALEELELPEGLLEIGEGAYRKCRNLEYVYLPDTLKKIGKWTFHGCTRLAVLETRHDPEEIGEWITNKGCVIRCPRGSRMEAYARNYGMTVEYTDSL